MLDTFLSGPYVPFSLALALLFGLLAVEIVALLLGGTLIGDGPDADFDLDIADTPDVDLSGFDIDPGEFELAESGFDTGFDTGLDGATGDAVNPESMTPSGPLNWLGFGKVPTLTWIATLLMFFGLGGIVIQGIVESGLGFALPAGVVALPVGAAALWLTGKFSAGFARLLPKSETQSVSDSQLGRRRGIVTQGTASRNMPAEVKVTDRYGNTHYIRAEPMGEADTIQQGTEVLVLRHRATGGYRLIAL